MFRIFKNLIENIKGYSSCSKCGDTWNWKKSHSIPFEGGGMFPLCEECYQSATEKEKISYATILINEWIIWMEQNKDRYYDTYLDEIARYKKNLSEAIENIKKGL